jgi:hypothetical protein
MDKFWLNFAFEIGFFSLLGILYYFYQKRKIVRYEENKTPIVINFLMQNCLAEKLDESQPQLDRLIETLDDFLNHKLTTPPLSMLRDFTLLPECSPELKEIILEGLKELEK